MALLTANTLVEERDSKTLVLHEVAAAENIFKGGLLGIDPAGFVKTYVIGDIFVGQAYEASDNSSGSAGDTLVRVVTDGDIEVSVPSVDRTDISKACFAQSDNPDDCNIAGFAGAYMGRVLSVQDSASGKCRIRLKMPFENVTTSDDTIFLDNPMFGVGTGASGGTAESNGWLGRSTLGLGLESNGDKEIQAQIDATSEAANVSVISEPIFDATLGCRFEIECRMSAAAGAAIDMDWGFADAVVATAFDGATHVHLHQDGDTSTPEDTLLLGADDTSNDVAEADTAINLSATVNGRFVFIVRTTGIAEVWHNEVLLTAPVITTAVLTGDLIAFFNIEKTATTQTATAIIVKMRAWGGS